MGSYRCDYTDTEKESYEDHVGGYNQLMYKPTLETTTPEGITLTVVALSNEYLHINEKHNMGHPKFQLIANYGDLNQTHWNFNSGKKVVEKFHEFAKKHNLGKEYMYQQEVNSYTPWEALDE